MIYLSKTASINRHYNYVINLTPGERKAARDGHTVLFLTLSGYRRVESLRTPYGIQYRPRRYSGAIRKASAPSIPTGGKKSPPVHKIRIVGRKNMQKTECGRKLSNLSAAAAWNDVTCLVCHRRRRIYYRPGADTINRKDLPHAQKTN